jgi:hypothetical protein
LEVVHEVAQRHVPRTFEYPDDVITERIVTALDSFAAASKGRYANFTMIADGATSHEPVALWWAEVVDPILEKHFAGTKAMATAEANSARVHSMLGGNVLVRHWDEAGQPMQSAQQASMRTAMNVVAQKYGRFYTLRLVRWMADVYKSITSMANSSHDLRALFGHDEWFSTFLVEDAYLLNRKVWPLRWSRGRPCAGLQLDLRRESPIIGDWTSR